MIKLDIIITDGWLILLIIAIILFAISYLQKDKQNQNLQSVINLTKSEAEKKFAELKLTYQEWAILEFEKFKEKEIESIKINYQKASIETASAMLKQWKIENEAKIRKDAINRSYTVNLGKITEHLLPYHESFLSQFNPKDARFIGSPIDLIIFDGYADKKDEISVYLVEIKTGNSKLTEIQTKVRDAVNDRRVYWAEINPKDYEAKKETNKEILLENFKKILVSISDINNILNTDEFIDIVFGNMKKAARLVIEDDWNEELAVEHELDKMSLIFNSLEEKQEFIKVLKNMIF